MKALREQVAAAAGWLCMDATRENPIERDGMRLPNYFGPTVVAWWHPDKKGVWGTPPPLTLDWLRELRSNFTDGEQDRYHSELCDILRPRTSVGIVSFWDLIQASIEDHAEAYLNVRSKQ